MNIFLIPKIINIICKEDIDLNIDSKSDIIISKTLYTYLISIKKQIDEYINLWDIYKKYTNPYEYIHSLVPEKRCSVSKYKPLSRSFYKFIEICSTFNLLPDITSTINTFHLAEGPGGFIEAIIYLHNNPENNYIGMTLQSNDIDVPSWKKSNEFLKKNKNVYIENGANKNGNLLEIENLKYCYENYKNKFDIITGDGGFDFSINFNNQEEQSLSLIFAQILYAISMQKIGGCFVIKFFDTFTKGSIDLLYILSSYYNSVNIIKPYTSRIANSEKYIVCENYKENDYSTIEYLIDNFSLIINNNNILNSLLKINLPYYFINKVEDFNAILGQQQIENINTTINKIINRDNNNNENNKELIDININKCINWCNRYNIPISPVFST